MVVQMGVLKFVQKMFPSSISVLREVETQSDQVDSIISKVVTFFFPIQIL